MHSFVQEHFRRKKSLADKLEKQKHCTTHSNYSLLNFVTPTIGVCPVCGKFISKYKLSSKERSLFHKAFHQKELEKKWEQDDDQASEDDFWLPEIYESA